MRLSLATSLVFHAAALAVAWVAWTMPGTEARVHLGASLHYREAAPDPLVPPPPPPAPPPPACEQEPEMEVEVVEAVEIPDAPAPEAAAPVAPRAAPTMIRLRRTLPRPVRTPPQEPVAAVPPVPAPPPPPAAPRAAVYRAPERVAERGSAPVYPLRARRLGLEGRLILRLEVAADGSVAEVAVLESSGHAILDEAAVEAARTWVFVPARRDGRPVAGTIRVPVSFALRP